MSRLMKKAFFLSLLVLSVSAEGDTTSAEEPRNARHHAVVELLFHGADVDVFASRYYLPRSRLLARGEKRWQRKKPGKSHGGINTGKKKMKMKRKRNKKKIQRDATRDSTLVIEASLDNFSSNVDIKDKTVTSSQPNATTEVTTTFSFAYPVEDGNISSITLSSNENTTEPIEYATISVSDIEDVEFINTTTAPHVDRMYTYGAPSVVKGSSASNQCMPGKRIFTEDIAVVECLWYEFWCTPGRQVTNVDIASQMNVKNGYHHPKIDTLVIQLVGGTNVEYISHPCNSDESEIEGYQWWPEASLPANQNNHELLNHYETRLAHVPYFVQGPSLEFISVSQCVTHSNSLDEIKYCVDNYSTESHLKLEGVAALGWDSFAYMSIESERFGITDTDRVYVLKNDIEPSRKCIISFQSSDSLLDFTNFAWTNNDETTYCGHDGVHAGTSDELRRITHDSQWSSNIVPALETCHEVTCVGHSLGGSLCNLFTVCANQGLENLDGSDDTENWGDYTALIWKKPS